MGQYRLMLSHFLLNLLLNLSTRQVRYLDKLVDELAKGRKMEKILRQSGCFDSDQTTNG
jgi:Uncharacterized protein conserved in bacteria (DUF2200)